jgi:hypothetical protein
MSVEGTGGGDYSATGDLGVDRVLGDLASGPETSLVPIPDAPPARADAPSRPAPSDRIVDFQRVFQRAAMGYGEADMSAQAVAGKAGRVAPADLPAAARAEFDAEAAQGGKVAAWRLDVAGQTAFAIDRQTAVDPPHSTNIYDADGALIAAGGTFRTRDFEWDPRRPPPAPIRAEAMYGLERSAWLDGFAGEIDAALNGGRFAAPISTDRLPRAAAAWAKQATHDVFNQGRVFAQAFTATICGQPVYLVRQQTDYVGFMGAGAGADGFVVYDAGGKLLGHGDWYHNGGTDMDSYAFACD